MPRALVVGGTGLIGRAVARRLLANGWRVDVTGRDPARMPADLRDAGVRFSSLDRADSDALAKALGGGADLLLDCVCYTAAHARALLPLLPHAGSTLMISSKAVYVDDAGNHSNSAEPPRFLKPVTESQPTLAPSDSDEYDSRAGYGACKVAAENLLLDTGHPVTVLRPSKVHGEGALKPNEWVFVKRVLDRRPNVFLSHRGEGADHTSAAVNIAALVHHVADRPGRRILNSADPDSPNALAIARIVAAQFGHGWTEVLLGDDADPRLGRHPWDRRPPVRLDMSAAEALGYRPVGDYRTTVAPALDWLATIAQPGRDGVELPAGYDNEYFTPMVDYAAEDAYLATQPAGY